MIVDDLPVPGADGVDPILKRDISIERLKKIIISLPVFDLLGHGQESLFDVCRILRGGLKEGNRKLVGKFLQ